MLIDNITQTISTIPMAGKRGVDVQTIFVNKQEAFQDALTDVFVGQINTLRTQLNTFAGQVNTTATQVNTDATTASTSATTATTKASEASTSASQALTSRNQAETFKNSASTSATTATTKASEASASATSASTSATTATTKASEASASATSASTSATTATTKASEASASATSASTSAGQALTSRNQAETFAQQAQASAESVDANNIVHRTGDETISGVKTFSSSPIVPTPTTDFQATTSRSTNITVNVGTGQTYTTINQALEYLSGFYPLHKTAGVTATINLKSGFVMNEQVLVRGLNLGWITIVGEDAETIITHTALTTAFHGEYPAFGVDKGGTSPVIGQLFRFNVEKVGGGKHGIMSYSAGSSADVLRDKGFIGAGANGIVAVNGSTINASGANASNAGTNGIIAYNGSTINADGANASNAGTNGIFSTTGSTINAIGAIIQNQTTGTSRVLVANGSHIVAIGINTSGGTVPVFSQTASTLTANGIIYG